MFVENKRFSFTVHYRLAPSAERPLRNIVKQLVDSIPIAVDMMDAHYAIEIKSPCFDKGGAIATFLATSTFRGRTPIFVGDDTTDESGFALVSARGGSRLFSRPSAPRRDWRILGRRKRCAGGSLNSPLEEAAHDRGHVKQKSRISTWP